MIWQNHISPKAKGIVEKAIEVQYGIYSTSCALVNNGFSNLKYLVQDKNSRKFIARISNARRSDDEIAQEEYVLQKLAETELPFSVPHLIPTLNKELRVEVQIPTIHKLHLFNYIEGENPLNWWQVPDEKLLVNIAEAYKILNNSLSKIKVKTQQNPFSSFKRLLIVAAKKEWINKQVVKNELLTSIDKFIVNGYQIINHVENLSQNFSKQWTHEDIQTENFLFDKNEIAGILDFENVEQGYKEVDIILSAFRICKFGKDDDKLKIDKSAFFSFLNRFPVTFEEENYKLWISIFALQQSLLYIKNAINNCWILHYNIGFLPCFNTVLQYK